LVKSGKETKSVEESQVKGKKDGSSEKLAKNEHKMLLSKRENQFVVMDDANVYEPDSIRELNELVLALENFYQEIAQSEQKEPLVTANEKYQILGNKKNVSAATNTEPAKSTGAVND
jgi:hypothetical protein